MTTIVITLTATCSGGAHLTYNVTGAKTMTVPGILSDALLAVSDDEAVAFCKIISKMAKAGRTLSQAKTLLEAGVTVTV